MITETFQFTLEDFHAEILNKVDQLNERLVILFKNKAVRTQDKKTWL